MDHSILEGILVLLILSVFAVTLVRRLHLPPILGYLLIGAVFGENAVGWIPGGHEIEFLAELGVVFLLFMIGLEVSIAHLYSMRRVLFSLGGLQVLFSTGSTILIAILGGMNWESAFVVGGALALSSTAIVIKQLQEQLEMHSRHGRNALGILLFQDLAVIPFLVIVPILASDSDTITTVLIVASLKALLAFALVFGVGHWLLRPILRWVMSSYSVELFTLTILLLSLFAAWATNVMGLSLALGAFLAGVMLAETEYRHQIETEIRPFRDVLLGLFFVTVGTQLNIFTLSETWLWALLLTLGVIIGKGMLIFLLSWYFQKDKGVAFRTGAVLAQGGEFGFAILTLALTNNVISEAQAQPILAALVISMAISPMLIRYNGKLAQFLFSSYSKSRAQQEMALADDHEHDKNHVIIAGFGRVGQNLGRFLREEKMPYVALDVDSQLIKEAFEAGEPVHYGDTSHPEILKKTGIMKASAMVITFHDKFLAEKILKVARDLNKNLPIVVRTRNDKQMENYEKLGATTVVPESLESSLVLATRTLELLGVDHMEIKELINRTRDDHYAQLRGVFQGEEIEIDSLQEGLTLHSVLIDEKADVMNLNVSDISKYASKVSLLYIKRKGERIEASAELKLEIGDVVVLRGTSEENTKIEKYFLKNPKKR